MRCVSSLCVLLFLTACMGARPPLVRTEIVEVPVVQYVRMPPALTDQLQGPAAPAFACTAPTGQPVVCVHDGLMREVEWQAILARANEDRATTAFLGAGAGTAPEFQPANNPGRLERAPSQLLRQAFGRKAAGAGK